MTVINHEQIALQTAEKLEQVMQTRSPQILTACFGRLCNQHAKCARWHAVVTGGPDHPRQATCLSVGGKRAGFVAVAA